jgi:hypothetical protein
VRGRKTKNTDLFEMKKCNMAIWGSFRYEWYLLFPALSAGNNNLCELWALSEPGGEYQFFPA